MRIALIAAGSGNRFYCENCSCGGRLAQALRARGHEVTSASLYMPTQSETEEERTNGTLFYGAVGLFLRHRFPALRAVPRWLGRALDAPGLLRLAARFSGSTSAAGLEDLTLAMLEGYDTGPSPDLDSILRWLSDFRPDVVHLSNCLLLGLARPIRRQLGISITCTLQDEDTWIDSLSDKGRAIAWQTLRDRAACVDMFTPVSRHYARFMGERLAVAEGRMSVVPVGIDVDAFRQEAVSPPRYPVIGYLSRISETMGAGLLADAFLLLAREGTHPGLRLRLMGGSTAFDRQLLRSIRRAFARSGSPESLEILHPFGIPDRARFLAGLTVLSVPVLRGEAFGIFLLEAMASGVPVVQPRLGGFIEVVEETGGGVLYEPNTAEALAGAIGRLLSDPARARALGKAGRNAVEQRYTWAHMAAGLEEAMVRATRRERT